MRVPVKWLNEHIEIDDINIKHIEEKLILSGSNTEGVKDFSKNNTKIVVGKVLEQIKHPDADKLVVLKVDIGEGVDEEGNTIYRQILSGIRTYIDDPQSIVGKKYPFLINLEPRTIRGFESQGMILAGIHEDTLMLLEPSDDVPPGTKIK